MRNVVKAQHAQC